MREDASSRGWVDAVIAFKNDINAKVLCPVCKKGFLKATDNYFSKSDPLRFEREMVCTECGANAASLHSGLL